MAQLPTEVATDRKHCPVADVASAGGLKGLATLFECYQQADADTMRARVGLAPVKRNVHNLLYSKRCRRNKVQTAP
jgi:hypothetical protein